MRKLASVQKVISVEEIPGADKIEKIRVLGWQLVAKKGEFHPGDSCVYVEIDSVLPEEPQFEFLRPNFRLRSKKMRGVVSQGLAMPMHILPDVDSAMGDDVTELLGITKWEPVAHSAKEFAGLFPTHLVPKTDEPRLQSVPDILEELRGTECYVSVKMDGQSLTFIKFRDGEDIVNKVCMRNFEVKDIPGSHHWDMARELCLFENMPEGFAVQGEFVGEGIQANRLGIKGRDFLAFQVFNIAAQKYLHFKDFIKFCADFKIKTVPIENPSLILNHSLEDMLKMSEGLYSSGHHREGVVIRPVVESLSDALCRYNGNPQRTSFKVISNTYLLKIGE